jgi:hypothetical protein
MFSNFFSGKSCPVWNNVVKSCTAGQATDDSIIRRMRFACWINKATDTHSEYVILIAFRRQIWLRERVLTLRLYVHCLVDFIWDCLQTSSKKRHSCALCLSILIDVCWVLSMFPFSFSTAECSYKILLMLEFILAVWNSERFCIDQCTYWFHHPKVQYTRLPDTCLYSGSIPEMLKCCSVSASAVGI